MTQDTRIQLSRAIRELRSRGLKCGAKWCGEQLISQSSTNTTIIYEEKEEAQVENDDDLYTLALLYFECGEFKQCSNTLQGKVGSKSKFLASYAAFLATDSIDCMQDETNLPFRKFQGDGFLHLYNQLVDYEDKDAFIYYLLGIICIRLKRDDDAKRHLCKSVEMYPYNRSAWLELSRLIDSLQSLREVISRVEAGFMTSCFRILVLNELNISSDDTHALLDDVYPMAPKFTQLQRAILYHNTRG
jgi:anaphase-promoting complex subunit 8